MPPPATIRTVCSACGAPATVLAALVLHAVDGADVLGPPWPSCDTCAVSTATHLPAPQAGHAQVTGTLLTPLTPLRLLGDLLPARPSTPAAAAARKD